MDTKHTPGPWVAANSGNNIQIGTPWNDPTWQPPGQAIGQVIAQTVGNSPNCQANARLIAAAPALVEALKGLFAECSMIHTRWGDGW